MDLSEYMERTIIKTVFMPDPNNPEDESWRFREEPDQEILSYNFPTEMNIYGMKVKASAETGPKRLKIYRNQSSPYDFLMSKRKRPAMKLRVIKGDLQGRSIYIDVIEKVKNLVIFLEDNQSGSGEPEYRDFRLFGAYSKRNAEE